MTLAILLLPIFVLLSLGSTNGDVLLDRHAPFDISGDTRDDLKKDDAPPEDHAPFDMSDDAREQLKKSEYHHVDEDDEDFSLNCTSYATDDVFVPFANGSLFIPEQDRIFDEDSYVIKNGTAHFCVDDTPLKQKHNFSDEFAQCGAYILIEPQEYALLKNGTIFIEIYSRTYRPTDYFIVEKGVYICLPAFEEMQKNKTIPFEWQKFSKHSDYVTVAGLLISIVSLLTHLVIFCFLPSVRNLPGSNLASLSLSLLLAYTCFLTAFLLEHDAHCAELGMCVYYFFLTAFFWMNAIAFDTWRSFRSVMRELRIASRRIPWKRFLLYSLYSWGVPALLTIMVKLFDATEVLPEDFRPSFGDPMCWFGRRKALLVFFALPLIVVMLLNIAFFADVVFVIKRATMKIASVQDAKLKKNFVMFTRLALIMGLTWIFGVTAGVVDRPFLWYVFIILNTLQGLFIFAVFMGSSKVRGLCFKEYKNRGKRTSTSIRTVSAAL